MPMLLQRESRRTWRGHLYNEWDTGSFPVEFHAFNAEYVQRLTEGDPVTEADFSVYFGKFLSLKLRARRVSPEMAEDVRQETFLRVLRALRQGSGVTQPERFGAFVNAVCQNVLLELGAKQAKLSPMPENAPDPPDDRIDFDASLVTEQRKRIVAEVLKELSVKDREILRMIFFEEADRSEVCRRLGVDAEYLRVLLHRAKTRFEAAWQRKQSRLGFAFMLVC